MNLLLHIGSHKTASTSLQHFCALNRPALKTRGFFYPRSRDSAYVFNDLASAIAFGRQAETAQFLKQARTQAQALKSDTVVISAESFYAMTAFFVDIQGHARNVQDYWKNERLLIGTLKEGCEGFDEVRIACYLRPQDDLASSLYNQFVKNVVGTERSYESFIDGIKPVFDYDRHISLWEEVFGMQAVTVRNFTAGGFDIVKDFCEHFLDPECHEQAVRKDHHANTRLTRDVLEVKRIYNRIKPDRPLAFIAARCFREISGQFKDQPGYQVFAPLAARRDFFSLFAAGNEALAARQNIAALPVITADGEPSYPGLEMETAAEIHLRFRMMMDRPANRIELAARRLANTIMNRVPGGRTMLAPVRALHNHFRLRFAGW